MQGAPSYQDLAIADCRLRISDLKGEETLYKEGKLSTREIAKMLGISKSTLYAYLRHRGVEIGRYRNRSDGRKH